MTRIRYWWWRKQGLDGSLQGKRPSEILASAGWARSVGGAAPYLTLFARGGVRRAGADAAAAKLEICELPSARACTYVIPARDFPLALKAGAGFANECDTARRLGVPGKEIDKLCAGVIDALAKAPLDPDELRQRLGGLVRNLGEEGKKKGLTTTLPAALGRLQEEGEIRRVPVDGRLDRQRYRYTLWRPNPLAKFKLSREEVQVELARRYFSWIAPATPGEFQWFSGWSGKEVKQAASALNLVPEEEGSERLLFAEDAEALRQLKVPKEPEYALVSSLDSIALLRRDFKSLLDEADMGREAFTGKGAFQLSGLADLLSHAILDRGRLIGLWEFDPVSSSIVWVSFVRKSRALEQAVLAMEEFVRDDLGDARSFSLDSPKSRAPKITALRAHGA